MKSEINSKKKQFESPLWWNKKEKEVKKIDKQTQSIDK